MAVRSAVEEGLRIAVLERKHTISAIHRSCGGVLNVNEPTYEEIVRFDEDRHRIDFEKLGISLDYDGPHQDVYGFHIYSPGGLRLEFGNFADLRHDPKANRLGVSVSKGMLLQNLLDDVAGRGAEIFPDTNVCGVRHDNDGAVVMCEDGREFRGSMIIAADGINSRIARCLGLNKQREFYGTSRDVSVMIEGTDCPDPDGFLFMITPVSIFSMIPVAQKNCYHIYASTYRRDKKPPELMRYFLHDDPTFSPWYRKSRVLEHRTACVVNLMNPIEKPYCNRVLLIGDACWRREMSNVGSMCTGWKAGKAVARALAAGKLDEGGLQEYLEYYQQYFYGPLGVRKQSGRDFTDYLTPDDIDYLAGLPDKGFPQTMDIFKVVKYIGSTYADFMTRIYEERPETMDRMMEMRNNMDDDMQKRIKWGFRNA
jgi:flavin-dependent dehydrogenase